MRRLLHELASVCGELHDVRQARESERSTLQLEGRLLHSTQAAHPAAALRVEREPCWSCATRKRVRESAHPFMQHRVSDCVRCSARLDFRQSKLRLRKHHRSCSIALSSRSHHIYALNVFIGAVGRGWSELLRTIVALAFLHIQACQPLSVLAQR